MAGRIGVARFIVVHHPAWDGIDDVRELIHGRFIAPPYDYFQDWETASFWVGRSLSMTGAHVIPVYPWALMVNNRTAIGVAIEGNFDDEKPPIGPEPRHIESMAIMLARLCHEHSIRPFDITTAYLRSKESLAIMAAGGILPHCVASRTSCPGRHFLVHWRALIGKTKFYYQNPV